jgi:hypothetical protein
MEDQDRKRTTPADLYGLEVIGNHMGYVKVLAFFNSLSNLLQALEVRMHICQKSSNISNSGRFSPGGF